MIKANFTWYEYDSCVYFKQNYDDTTLLLCVDDMLITSRNMTYIQKIKAQLKREFDMKNLGEAKKILGMESLEIKVLADFDYLKRTMF